ncbi:hypothetical protein QTJ16_000807 [Diplocarpon rosae]|uniref:Eisosome protein 1 n=1 Tax=Diplocarpon rosae TaxID=946125 RepID=A0AAD9WFN8_9HELO|nr:hypothetical protein QTJ16_000807 [Diplocarpon rosae]
MAQASAVLPTGPVPDASKPHTSSTRLEDQAALAALYVTGPKHDNNNNNNNASKPRKDDYDYLDKDHRLSSAGAAASLKYANPQDLPSYSPSGLKKNDISAAGAAASLGWANQKSFEHWKPEPSGPAAAAALLAHDYKMAPLWQPESSADGAKAALLAHREGGKVEIWKPEAHSVWGHSAATQAMVSHRQGGLSPQLDYGHTELGRQGSLRAATGAMSSSRKKAEAAPRIVPKPDTYPDESNAASNALMAATSASRASKRSDHSEGGAVPYTNMSRNMYTANPPVQPEIDEKNRADTLRASAVAMAQGMYAYQQKQIDQASAHAHAQSGAAAAHGHRRTSSLDSTEAAQPTRFNNLQEAAQKLAQERLAKLHDENAQNREYRDYYSSTSAAAPSRLSIRGRNRNRASSLSTFDEDQAQSDKIRAQMSQFSSNLDQVDAKKRQHDRDSLIAVAQRNVTKSMHGMDEKVLADTGKMAPSLLSEWEARSHAAAQANSASRMENHGKVHIGGGKFINQSEIDLVASRNIQPVLDEINEKAEAERERQAALKLEQETQQRNAAEKKAREKEQREIEKKLRQQDIDERKMEAADEKRAAKERRKSLRSGGSILPFGKKTTDVGDTARRANSEKEPAVEPVPREGPTIADRRDSAALTPIRTSMEDQASVRMRETVAAANGDTTLSSPLSPGSPKDGKVKSWLKTKFSRRMSKSQKSPGLERENETVPGDRRSFIGGAALTGASANDSTGSLGAKSSSIRDVATATSAAVPAASTAGETTATALRRTITVDSDPDLESGSESDLYSEHTTAAATEPAFRRGVGSSEPRGEMKGRRISKASVVSSTGLEDDEEFQEARDNFDEGLAPPPTFPAETIPARTAKFHEDI